MGYIICRVERGATISVLSSGLSMNQLYPHLQRGERGTINSALSSGLFVVQFYLETESLFTPLDCFCFPAWTSFIPIPQTQGRYNLSKGLQHVCLRVGACVLLECQILVPFFSDCPYRDKICLSEISELLWVSILYSLINLVPQ